MRKYQPNHPGREYVDYRNLLGLERPDTRDAAIAQLMPRFDIKLLVSPSLTKLERELAK